MTILEWLDINDFWASVALSILINFIFMIISVFREIKQNPRYSIESRTIISDTASLKSEFNELEVYYKDSIIRNLTETRLYFWNAGRKSIRESHLLKATPIEIKIPDDIVVYNFEYASTLDLEKTLGMNKTEQGDYKISFDAMQRHDGICFKILHSGKEDCSISIIGKLDNLIKIKKSKTLPEPNYTEKIVFGTMFCASTALLVYTIINELSLRMIYYDVSPITWSGLISASVESSQFGTYMMISIFFMIATGGLFFYLMRFPPIPIKLLYISKQVDKYKKSLTNSNSEVSPCQKTTTPTT